MSENNVLNKLKYVHKKLNGSTITYDLSGYKSDVEQIRNIRKALSDKSDNELQTLVSKIKLQIQLENETHNSRLDIFAICAEIIKRKHRIDIHDTQLIGALAIDEGKLIEMQTGEGKTLTAVFPAVYNALAGKNVHILTYNEYLAKRDAEWMKDIYNGMGISVGYIVQKMNKEERKTSYKCDVTYLTAKEAGFDYLRDNLVSDKRDKIQTEFNYVIVDEADSILLDESRSPLIIAGRDENISSDEKSFAGFVKKLKVDEDFFFDDNNRNFHYSDNGINKIEKYLGCGNMYEEQNIDLLTKLNCAVHAEFLFTRDVDYIVRDNKIELVDEFTGRVADKRRWPDGLQEAIEQKEELEVQPKGKVLNSITLQHFIRLYDKISGMTGTAAISEEEFKRFYDLDVVVIPTHKKCIRKDSQDRIFKTKKLKYEAVVEEIISVHKSGRPVLVGTSSVAESILIYEKLKKEKISCQLLNAKNDEFEAELIANAGKLNFVTISTNMAGRGTDIKLGGEKQESKTKIVELGGLYVIGTNRYESSRIDNQLKGRSGRQGDPGSTRFFISLEDDLYQKFNLIKLIPASLKSELEKDEITHKGIKKEIERVQRIVEGQNLEIKKTVCRYSDLVEGQRKIFQIQRNKFLEKNYLTNEISPQLKTISEKKEFIESVLNFIDSKWSDYLDKISDLKEGIHFLRLGGEDPFYQFQKKVINFFKDDFDNLKQQVIEHLINVNNELYTDEDIKKMKRPSATWTYIINDDPFENIIGNMLSGNRNIGMSIGLIMTWPLFLIMPLLKKIKLWKEKCK